MRRNFMVVVIIIAGLLYLLDKYVYQGIVVLSESIHVAPDVLKYFYIFNCIFWPALFAMGLIGLNLAKGVTKFQSTVLALFFAFFVSQLVFSSMLLVEDIYRLLRYGIERISSKESVAAIPRNIYVSAVGLIASIFIFFSFLYGMFFGKYRYKVHKHSIYFDDLPEAFDGFTIAQISDIHSGSFDNAKGVQKGIDMLMKQKPDLFVFTGDLVNNTASEFEPWIETFAQIKAPYGQFSILGNHDYGDYIPWPSEVHKKLNLDRLKGHHHATGFKLLLDEGVTIEKDGQSIYLLGVENWGLGFGQRGDLAKAMKHAHPHGFKVLLSHDPSHWDAEVKHHEHPIHLTLSGHTHGMQFGIDRKWLKWSPVKYRYPKWAGLYHEAGRYIHVNRGFGFLGLSARVGIWPEISILELKRKV